MSAFSSSILAARPALASPIQTTPLPVGEDEVTFTTDPILNFVQLAVRTCQRANGATSKPAREAWVRLCGTYQSKSGALSQPEVRRVSYGFLLFYHVSSNRVSPAGPERTRPILLRYTASAWPGIESSWGHDVCYVWWWTFWRGGGTQGARTSPCGCRSGLIVRR